MSATTEHVFTAEETAALRLLDDRGFAVCVFTPEELRGADTDRVAERLIEFGWDVIDDLSPDDVEAS